MPECQWNLVSSPNFTVEMLPYCYLSSLFLNILQSCLVTLNSIRHYRPLFPEAHFELLLLKLLYEGWNFNSGNYLFTTETK